MAHDRGGAAREQRGPRGCGRRFDPDRRARALRAAPRVRDFFLRRAGAFFGVEEARDALGKRSFAHFALRHHDQAPVLAEARLGGKHRLLERVPQARGCHPERPRRRRRRLRELRARVDARERPRLQRRKVHDARCPRRAAQRLTERFDHAARRVALALGDQAREAQTGHRRALKRVHRRGDDRLLALLAVGVHENASRARPRAIRPGAAHGRGGGGGGGGGFCFCERRRSRVETLQAAGFGFEVLLEMLRDEVRDELRRRDAVRRRRRTRRRRNLDLHLGATRGPSPPFDEPRARQDVLRVRRRERGVPVSRSRDARRTRVQRARGARVQRRPGVPQRARDGEAPGRERGGDAPRERRRLDGARAARGAPPRARPRGGRQRARPVARGHAEAPPVPRRARLAQRERVAQRERLRAARGDVKRKRVLIFRALEVRVFSGSVSWNVGEGEGSGDDPGTARPFVSRKSRRVPGTRRREVRALGSDRRRDSVRRHPARLAHLEPPADGRRTRRDADGRRD